mmetsp:Transcript_5475/g.13229  ORF Transcript_5475/g.13229 Transcript_5475/m.13229 type:complete len:266 (+) Transcript_5475:1584-2381(+)
MRGPRVPLVVVGGDRDPLLRCPLAVLLRMRDLGLVQMEAVRSVPLVLSLELRADRCLVLFSRLGFLLELLLVSLVLLPPRLPLHHLLLLELRLLPPLLLRSELPLLRHLLPLLLRLHLCRVARLRLVHRHNLAVVLLQPLAPLALPHHLNLLGYLCLRQRRPRHLPHPPHFLSPRTQALCRLLHRRICCLLLLLLRGLLRLRCGRFLLPQLQRCLGKAGAEAVIHRADAILHMLEHGRTRSLELRKSAKHLVEVSRERRKLVGDA